MTTCHKEICPHMHFNKCYAQRIRSIPVTIFPDPTIDSFTNVNTKCGKQYKSNISTLAYEKFTLNNQALSGNRNFMKDFYMENFVKDKMVLNNNIVQNEKEDMSNGNAYVLAEGATKDYEQFQADRKKTLVDAQQRANKVYEDYFKQQKLQKQKNYEENGQWLKKLYRKLEEVAVHIISGIGESASEKQKQFLLSKSNLNAKFLSQIKLKNPKNACDILEELRILMQKKKLHFFDQKEEQQLNKSKTQSFLSSEPSQNSSQNSMLSQETSLGYSTHGGQNSIVQKFWDFNQLKKKWKLQDIEEVKQMIRKVLTKKVVFNAEVSASKQRRQKDRLNKQLQKMQGKTLSKEKIGKQSKESQKNQVRKKVENTVEKKLVQYTARLSKQEESVMKAVIEGGRFDSIGQQFMRNKTYSEIFKNKENKIKSVFIQKQLPETVNTFGKDKNLLKSTNVTFDKKS